jgi:hypothetical protein
VAVGKKANALCLLSVFVQSEDLHPGPHVPNPDSSVGTAGRHPLPVRTKGDIGHKDGMTAQFRNLPAGEVQNACFAA